MLRISFIVFSLIIVTAEPSWADSVYFVNGQVYDNAVTRETAEGIWVDGVLFKKSEILRIEKKAVVRPVIATSTSQAPWWQNVLNFFQHKSQALSNVSKNIIKKDDSLDARIRAREQQEKLQAQQDDAALRKRLSQSTPSPQSQEPAPSFSMTKY